jgi:hypothetical protein
MENTLSTLLAPLLGMSVNCGYAFANLCFGLMVGIGAGVPGREHSIRLSDVVAGNHLAQAPRLSFTSLNSLPPCSYFQGAFLPYPRL